MRGSGFDITISEPCSNLWSEMAGGASQRTCTSCNKTVHNFSELTPAELEHLLHEAEAGLCGRITRRTDGSVVHAVPRAGLLTTAALLAASIGFAPKLNAQRAKAIVTGNLVQADGSPLRFPATIVFLESSAAKVIVRVETEGSWRTELTPGEYDLEAYGNINGGKRKLRTLAFHEGEQSIDTLALGQPEETTVDVGEIVAISNWHRTLLYRVKHPLRYIEYLRRRSS